MRPHKRLNGTAVAIPVALPILRPAPTPTPTCPKRCDLATPPEHAGGDRYVCIGCGTEFTWRPS